MSDICVIGSFVMDMVVRVGHFPEPGQTMIGNSMEITPGGKGCNQCVGAARLHANCEMIGVVGDDSYGHDFIQILKNEHIRHDHVIQKPGIITGVSQIQIDTNGENKIIVIPGANFAFDDTCIAQARDSIRECKLVMLQLELPLEMIYKIVDLCSLEGKQILLNPAPAVTLDIDLLKKIDYITPNETELAMLSNHEIRNKQDLIRALDILHDHGAKNIIATLGDKGCVVSNANSKTFIKGYFVKTLDTVAAGDCFNAALAKGIIDGTSLIESAKYANAAAAIAVTRKGAIASMPLKEEVDQFIRQEVA